MRLWKPLTRKCVSMRPTMRMAAVARGEPPGRAHGLPVVVKDVLKVGGYLEKVFGGWRTPSIVTEVA